MKEKDFGIESSKRKETHRGWKALAAGSLAAAAAFSLGGCGDSASAEQSGAQSGPSVEVSESATPAPSETETTLAPTAEPSETEQDTSWISKEYLQKIKIDYGSFEDWGSRDRESKLTSCVKLFYANGMTRLTGEDQSLDPTYASMTGQEIVDYWNKQNAIVWSIINDKTDERNGDVAKKLTECITSDQLSSTEHSSRAEANRAINGSLNQEPKNYLTTAPFIFEKVTQQSKRFFIAMPDENTPGGWNEYDVVAEVSRPSIFGKDTAEYQAVFEFQWFDEGPLWRLAADKEITDSDKSDLTVDVSRNLEPVE